MPSTAQTIGDRRYHFRTQADAYRGRASSVTRPVASATPSTTPTGTLPQIGTGAGANIVPGRNIASMGDYTNYAQNLRASGVVPQSPFGDGLPKNNPFTSTPWASPQEALDFQKQMRDLHAPIPEADALKAFQQNTIYNGATRGAGKTNVVQGGFLMHQGDFADDVALRNWDKLDAGTQKAYKDNKRRFDKEFSETFTKRAGSLTADQFLSLADRFYDAYGDQLGRHMQDRMTGFLQRIDPAGSGIRGEIEERRRQGMLQGNDVFRTMDEGEQARIRHTIAMLENARSVPLAIAKEYGFTIGGGDMVDPTLSPSSVADSIKRMYGLESIEPGTPISTGTIQVGNQGEFEVLSDGSTRPTEQTSIAAANTVLMDPNATPEQRRIAERILIDLGQLSESPATEAAAAGEPVAGEIRAPRPLFGADLEGARRWQAALETGDTRTIGQVWMQLIRDAEEGIMQRLATVGPTR